MALVNAAASAKVLACEPTLTARSVLSLWGVQSSQPSVVSSGLLRLECGWHAGAIGGVAAHACGSEASAAGSACTLVGNLETGGERRVGELGRREVRWWSWLGCRRRSGARLVPAL